MLAGLSLKMIGISALAVVIALGAGYGWGRWDGAALEDAAVEKALAEARAATEDAINELADEAERARVERRLCRNDPRGMRWSFEINDCVKAEAKP